MATSFATSFVWSTEVVAEDDDGRVLIDLAGLLTADALGLAKSLSRDGGKFSRVDDRSLPDASSVLVFPDNVEIDAWITFAGDEPGREIQATAADASAVTLVQHHSFVRLPDDGYRVRRVELLPEDAHPLDIRYNVVQWVHRQTRGWSYGGGIIDPRTGEMIKGHVILGSQRVRQDRMIFEGLAGVDAVGSGSADDPVELALDRIRQLAAHELGHALGFGHNFAASTNDRASVMDYPAPWVLADDQGGLDFSRAYDHGIAELENVLEVRARALTDFGVDRIADGRPLADLRQVLVPIYLYHRYQVDAAAKWLGGVRFSYARRGGPGARPSPVPGEEQRRALEVLLDTLDPARLDLHDELLGLMPPDYTGYWFDAGGEALPSRTDPAFDPFTAAETAADISFAALLDASRAERLAAQVHGEARSGLMELSRRLERQRGMHDFTGWMTNRIDQHLERPAPPANPVSPGPDIPPGSPIGGTSAAGPLDWVAEDCWHC